MKLKNKKTGEIAHNIWWYSELKQLCIYGKHVKFYNSLAELNEEWEDLPEEPKEIYFISNNGQIHEEDGHDRYREARKEIGNYFETREEAEKAVEKLKAWKRLKDECVYFKYKVIDRKWYLEPKSKPEWLTLGNARDLYKDIMLLFGGEE